jgi:two-component system, OmpR family, response regulator ChvI
MSQLDARLRREYSSVGDLDRLPATSAQDGPDSVAPIISGRTKLPRVVFIESDQYYREVLTVVLLSQGFVVHAFTDSTSLLSSAATVVNADLVVLDWDLSETPGKELLAQLRQRGANVPVVFLADKVPVGDSNDHQGAVDFIVKSRDRQVFIGRLRRLIEFAKPKTETEVLG